MSTRVNAPPIVRVPQRNPFKPGTAEHGFFASMIQAMNQQNIILEQLWRRTGGGTDTLADVEADTTTADGGNRTQRWVIDGIDELTAQIAEIKRSTRGDELSNLHDQLSEQKRHVRNLEQLVFDVLERESRRARRLEQFINELEERIDSGV